MTRALSVNALGIVFCALLTSSLAAIDVSNMDAHSIHEYSLLDIADSLALEYPTEVHQALRQLTVGLPVDTHDIGDQIFDQLLSTDTFANEQRRCVVCTVISFLITSASSNGGNMEQLTRNIIAGCHLFVELINDRIITALGRIAIKADPLCDGTVRLHLPHISKVLTSLLQSPPIQITNVSIARAANEFCQNLNKCGPLSLPLTLTPNSTSSHSFIDGQSKKISSGTGRSSRASSSDDVITVVQLTDIHVDPRYALNSTTECGLPVCCSEEWNSAGRGRARYFGEHSCDIPQRTIELFLSKVQRMNPDVILFSGDISPHTVWDESEESQTNSTILLTESIKRTLPNNSVYPCIGNHELFPTNLFSNASLAETRKFLPIFYERWREIARFTAEQNTDILKGGYYSMLIRPGLRLLSYNSNYMYTLNWYNSLNIKDPASPLQPRGEITMMKTFMQNVLSNARTNNEKVIILGHHPIGGSDYILSLSRWYQSLVVNYSDIIVLQPTGHTHLDEMRLIYDSTGNPASVVLVSPSITSAGTRNPSMRVFYLNKDDYTLVDYEQHALSLSSSQVNQQSTNVDLTDMITKLYSAKDTYEMSDLSPQSWHDLVERFESDPALLSRHLSLSDASAKTRYVCLEQCQHDYICRQRNADFDKYTECVDSYNGTRPSIDDVTRPQPDASSTTTQPPGSISTESSGLKTGAVNINVLMLVCIAALCGQRTFLSIDLF